MQQLTCLNCPLRCRIEVEHSEDAILAIEGNNCERGFRFALDSVNLPKRNLSAYVKVENSSVQSVKVATTEPISRQLVGKVEKILDQLVLKAPVKINDLVIPNVLDSGVDIIAVGQAALKS